MRFIWSAPRSAQKKKKKINDTIKHDLDFVIKNFLSNLESSLRWRVARQTSTHNCEWVIHVIDSFVATFRFKKRFSPVELLNDNCGDFFISSDLF